MSKPASCALRRSIKDWREAESLDRLNHRLPTIPNFPSRSHAGILRRRRVVHFRTIATPVPAGVEMHGRLARRLRLVRLKAPHQRLPTVAIMTTNGIRLDARSATTPPTHFPISNIELALVSPSGNKKSLSGNAVRASLALVMEVWPALSDEKRSAIVRMAHGV
jgi:hypothetical protein